MGNLIVAKRGAEESSGLITIHLHAFARIALPGGKHGYKHVGQTTARSGLPGKQTFRTRPNQVTGRYEPCPEGHYPLGPLEWAGKANDYTRLFPGINSPFWIEIDPARATGFHRDAGVPGTAGCIGLLPAQEKQLVNWINGYGRFTDLYTDWGLGYVKLPPGLTFGKG